MLPQLPWRIWSALVLITSPLAAQQAVRWQSPDGRLVATITVSQDQNPQWTLSSGDEEVMHPAPLGITLDGIDLGADSKLVGVQKQQGEETAATTGVAQPKPVAWTERVLELRHARDDQQWRIEARLFNNGFAWRYRIDGPQKRRVEGEASSYRLPLGSDVWVAERPNAWKLKSYAGYWTRVPVEKLATFSPVGPIQGPPLVAELPSGGYTLLTEAALADYSGMRLKAHPDGRLQVDFAPFQSKGPILTPWRIVVYAKDLDTLVNQRMIAALNPAPDEALFKDMSWIRYGKATWRWWSSGTGSPEQEREFIDYAARLGFAYTLVDDGWKKWLEPWQRVAELADYGKTRDVRILLWCDYKDLADPINGYSDLTSFLDKAKSAGVSGVKLDFFNAESKDRIDFEREALAEAARRNLIVIFHGIQKPTGESRTFPNEVTREGIRGIELNKMAEGPLTAEHNTALPFTRFVAGAGDYTPIAFSKPGPTTWAHQVATLVAFTSPVQVIAENPRMLLEDERTTAALPFIRDVPTVWDETRVLEGSEIGQLALLARRKGREWWLTALNNQPCKLERLNLSFLGDESYEAKILWSPERAALESETLSVDREWQPSVSLASGDGLIIRFTPNR